MAKKVDLGGDRVWKTQKAAREHFQEMLSRYKNGDKISAPEDHADLAALIQSYDANSEGMREPKAGAGISYFFRGTDMEHFGINDCFFVKRVDGTEIDFSFHKALILASQAHE
ncbi:DUF3223 domain-containing protein [Variovorax sp. W2I14]|uniref:DUF3223 domain-containing protein n=1 Tax=Variovorax sp. W2I14 TaxID=3042290 RepID=UPI003D23B120